MTSPAPSRSLGPLLIAAPLCIAGYGAIRLIGMADGRYGPGLDWQLAHLVALVGMVAFVPVILRLSRWTRPGRLRTTVVAATLFGLAASMVQFGADIVEALMAEDKAEMRRLSRSFTSIPGVEPVVYQIGPQLFFLGLVALAALLTRAGRLPWWSPVLILVSVVLPVFTLDLITVTGLGILIAFAPVRVPIGTA
ncbi:hypothetical protein F4553_001429 [Allocatelliglobosispora scoriae]|uniref:DUF4386 family protein n=1 Tax=Allocatelliglobosispora scoriae TaxID=643052 RepID=A0A841BMK1_9ACTN|nr:hypothetical protein [Allocatelliglobosispora scoriae]MBB5868050.1 hypothetical protein [Allocatelliglobosispora scoriae]